MTKSHQMQSGIADWPGTQQIKVAKTLKLHSLRNKTILNCRFQIVMIILITILNKNFLIKKQQEENNNNNKKKKSARTKKKKKKKDGN